MSEPLRDKDFASRRIATYVGAGDPISRAGLAAQLRGQPELVVVEDVDLALVAVVVTDTVDDDASRSIRAFLRSGVLHVLVIATALDDRGVLNAVEAGACAIMRRVDAAPEKLTSVLMAAMEGHGTLPPDLLGSLLTQVGRLQRNVTNGRGLSSSGFTEREVEVLRLVADGFDTAEIAQKLSYSERTVKNVIHDVTSRFNLRNRCHAVAHALRTGVI